jgi:type I restriction enzyme S subunit
VSIDPVRIDLRYFYYLTGYIGLNHLKDGTSNPSLSRDVFCRQAVPLPSLLTQRKIAGILSAYDDLIENNLRRIKILEQMAQSLYREWFVHFRFPGHDSAKFVDSALGQIPKGWEVKKLEQILELKYGKALKKEDRREGQYPVFGSSGIVGTHDISLTKGPGIVVGRKGNVGSVFWSDEDFFVIDTAYFVESRLPLRFLFYLLPTLNFINSDAAVPGLSRQQAYTLEAIVPPADLLTKFCTLADSFEKQASMHRLQNQNLRRTRDLLLPKLLSGG